MKQEFYKHHFFVVSFSGFVDFQVVSSIFLSLCMPDIDTLLTHINNISKSAESCIRCNVQSLGQFKARKIKLWSLIAAYWPSLYTEEKLDV